MHWLIRKTEKINSYLEVHNCQKNCQAHYLLKVAGVTSILAQSTKTDTYLKEYNIYFNYKVNFEQIDSYFAYSNKINDVVQNILSPKICHFCSIFGINHAKSHIRTIQTAFSVTYSETTQFFL